ncbi:hypothetical protein BJ508DRAFT_327179 [Ascobolus immersus RN42]|uniref:Uncharacterized protein n=1 Tax=Ascobolus immersus RN42 TaxID=1160509 RepID=A0A3N4I8Y1_ASCIM|nr:hypothetical protein BJ508DRAFT_327179 [Ascobolus immersus RN42]
MDPHTIPSCSESSKIHPYTAAVFNKLTLESAGRFKLSFVQNAIIRFLEQPHGEHNSRGYWLYWLAVEPEDELVADGLILPRRYEPEQYAEARPGPNWYESITDLSEQHAPINPRTGELDVSSFFTLDLNPNEEAWVYSLRPGKHAPVVKLKSFKVILVDYDAVQDPEGLREQLGNLISLTPNPMCRYIPFWGNHFTEPLLIPRGSPSGNDRMTEYSDKAILNTSVFWTSLLHLKSAQSGPDDSPDCMGYDYGIPLDLEKSILTTLPSFANFLWMAKGPPLRSAIQDSTRISLLLLLQKGLLSTLEELFGVRRVMDAEIRACAKEGRFDEIRKIILRYCVNEELRKEFIGHLRKIQTYSGVFLLVLNAQSSSIEDSIYRYLVSAPGL